MKAAFLALAALAALGTPAAAVGLLDPGAAVLRGHATDLVERRVVVDLWDAGQPPRAFTLRVLPDSDEVPGVEVRARPVQGTNGSWVPLEKFHLQASGDKKAQDRGWDGLYEVALRFRLPNQPVARLTLLLVPADGPDAIALTTRLEPTVLAVHATTEHGGLVAEVSGGKAPSGIDAVAGAQRWPLRPGADGVWRLDPAPPVLAVQLVARFADGAVLEGPEVSFREAPGAGPEAPAATPAAPAPGAPPAPGSGAGDAEPPQRAAPRSAPQDRTPGAAAASGRNPVPAVPISLAVGVLAALALGRRVAFK